MNARPLLLAAAFLGLAGCGVTRAPQAEAPAKARPAAAAYASDPFVPINLYLNPNEQAPKALATLIQYTAEQLRDGGAFVRVDQGVQRWPITLQARYRLQEDAGSGDLGRRLVGWLTLGLVPVRTTQVHMLQAEVLAEPDSVATIELSVTVENERRVFDRDAGSAGRAAADTLVERLLSEIAKRKLIPRWSAFKPDPMKKTTPVKPVGQPT